MSVIFPFFFYDVVIQFKFLCLFIDICLYYSTSSCTSMIMITNYTVIYMYLNMHILLIFSSVCGYYIKCIHVQSHYVLMGKLREEGEHQRTEYIKLIHTMANNHSMAGLPFANVAETIILDGQQNNYDKFNYIHSTNNDMLTNIDPDVNNMNPNSLKNQCKNYDT